MDFNLSPVPTPEDLATRHRARYQIKVLSEEAYNNFKEVEKGMCGAEDLVVNFLALEEPPIKKRIQRQEQRERLKAAPLQSVDIRSRRSICFHRAQEWSKLYKELFFDMSTFFVDGAYLLRREIGEDGKERVGSRGAVVGCYEKKEPFVKDKRPRYRFVKYEPPEQPELECMEQWRMGIKKPEGPVHDRPGNSGHRRYMQPVNPHSHAVAIGPRWKDGLFFKVETRRVRKAVAA